MEESTNNTSNDRKFCYMHNKVNYITIIHPTATKIMRERIKTDICFTSTMEYRLPLEPQLPVKFPRNSFKHGHIP